MAKRIENKGNAISRRKALAKLARFSCLASIYPLLNGCNLSQSISSERSGGDTTSSGEYSAWASGTTSLITVPFPDDGMFDDGDYCTEALSTEEELGPCYFSSDTGEDISGGKIGLPTQLCFRLIDSNCNPLLGYKVEVWHCDRYGHYSGDTSNSSDSSTFDSDSCTGSDSVAEGNNWFRGVLTTNLNGRVSFKTIFPGWYEGRTIHVNIAVVDNEGNRIFVSQLCFSDDLTYEVCTEHDLYNSRGKQDTTLASGKDEIFPIYNYETYMMKTSQNSDGSLLAYHTIQLVDL